MAFTLHHIAREPRIASANPPLLVLLHGVRSNEMDLLGLADQLDQRFFVISARAPLTFGPGAYGWYHVEFTPQGPLIDKEQAETSRLTLIKFLTELVEAYPIDPKRVYLLGFSQGCAMTLAALLTAPDKIAGAVGMSGRLPPGIETRVSPDLGAMPVLIVHGTADTVLPLPFGHEIRDFLSTTPVEMTYRDFPMGHHVTPQSLQVVSEFLTGQLDRS